MDSQETKNITVVIASRPYPLKVKQEEEASIRKIIKEINEKINRFQLTYTNKDKQDCLSMAILTYAVDLHKAQQNQTSIPSNGIDDKLSKLDSLLNQLLS